MAGNDFAHQSEHPANERQAADELGVPDERAGRPLGRLPRDRVHTQR
jgi:hypothetical protein